MNTANCADTAMSESSKMMRGMPARMAFCRVMICQGRSNTMCNKTATQLPQPMEPRVKGYTCWGTHLLSDHGQHLDVDTVAVGRHKMHSTGRGKQ